MIGALGLAALLAAHPAIAQSGLGGGRVAPRLVAEAPSRAVPAREAQRYVGETATICDRIASVYEDWRAHARPTFLDFGASYPRQAFTAVIFGKEKPAFGNLRALRGKEACVTGRVSLYRGKPEMILNESSQLRRR